MKSKACLIAVLLGLGLVACDKQEEAATPEVATPAAEAEAPVSAEPAAEPAKSGGGGYDPADDERVPGITVSKEEIEKQLAESLADTPKPTVPGEEPNAE